MSLKERKIKQRKYMTILCACKHRKAIKIKYRAKRGDAERHISHFNDFVLCRKL